MKKDYFKPEDFELLKIQTIDNLVKFASELANEKLQKLIESWPVVYDGNSGLSLSPGGAWSVVKHDEKDHIAISSNFTNSKRKARLAFIEEIKKEPCKHNPASDRILKEISNNQITTRCLDCGIELQATWSEKK